MPVCTFFHSTGDCWGGLEPGPRAFLVPQSGIPRIHRVRVRQHGISDCGIVCICLVWQRSSGVLVCPLVVTSKYTKNVDLNSIWACWHLLLSLACGIYLYYLLWFQSWYLRDILEEKIRNKINQIEAIWQIKSQFLFTVNLSWSWYCLLPVGRNRGSWRQGYGELGFLKLQLMQACL